MHDDDTPDGQAPRKSGETPPHLRRPRGRPAVLTPELIDAIAADVAKCNYIETVCRMHGIAKQTLYNWLERGGRERRRLEAWDRQLQRENGRQRKRSKAAQAAWDRKVVESEARAAQERLYVEFLDAIETAEAKAEVDAVNMLNVHGLVAWQSIAWRLERRFPDRFGRKDKVSVGGVPGEPVETSGTVKVSGAVAALGLNVKDLPDDDLNAAIELMERIQGRAQVAQGGGEAAA